MDPEVRYFLLCDEVRYDPDRYNRIDVFGLLTAVRSTAEPPFPVVRPHFSALILLAGCRGVGELVLRVVQDQTGAVIFRTASRTVRFLGPPDAVNGIRFHVRNCCFPAAGLCWVEVLFAGSVLARQKLVLRSGETQP